MRGGAREGGDAVAAKERAPAAWAARPLHGPGVFRHGLEGAPRLVREHPAGPRDGGAGLRPDSWRGRAVQRDRRGDGLAQAEDERQALVASAVSQDVGAPSRPVSQDVGTVSGGMSSDGVSGVPPTGSPSAGSPSAGSPQEPVMPPPSPWCGRCRAPHAIDECESVVCLRCKKIGHIARLCSARTANIIPPNGTQQQHGKDVRETKPRRIDNDEHRSYLANADAAEDSWTSNGQLNANVSFAGAANRHASPARPSSTDSPSADSPTISPAVSLDARSSACPGKSRGISGDSPGVSGVSLGASLEAAPDAGLGAGRDESGCDSSLSVADINTESYTVGDASTAGAGATADAGADAGSTTTAAAAAAAAAATPGAHREKEGSAAGGLSRNSGGSMEREVPSPDSPLGDDASSSMRPPSPSTTLHVTCAIGSTMITDRFVTSSSSPRSSNSLEPPFLGAGSLERSTTSNNSSSSSSSSSVLEAPSSGTGADIHRLSPTSSAASGDGRWQSSPSPRSDGMGVPPPGKKAMLDFHRPLSPTSSAASGDGRWQSSPSPRSDGVGMPPPGKKAMMAGVRQPALSTEQIALMGQLKQAPSAREVLEVLRRSSCTPHAGNYVFALQRASFFTIRGELVSGAELKGLNDVIAARLHELRPRDLGNAVNAWERLTWSPGPAVLRDVDALVSEQLDWGRDSLLVHGEPGNRAHVYAVCLLNGYARLVIMHGHRPSVETVRALDGTAAAMLGLAPDGPTRSRSKVLVRGAGSTSAEELASALLLQLQCGPAMEPPVRLGAGTWSVRLPNEGAVRRALAARVVVLGERQAQLSAASPEGRDTLAMLQSDEIDSIAGLSPRMLVACLKWFGCTNNVARSRQSPGGPAHGHHHEQQQQQQPPDEGLLRCIEARLHDQLTAGRLRGADLEMVFLALAGLRSGGLPLEVAAVTLARAGLLLDPDARLLADVDRRIEAELLADRMNYLCIARVLAGYVALGRLVPDNVMQLAGARLQQAKPFMNAKFVVNERHREDEVDTACLLLDSFARMGFKPPGSIVSRCVDVLAYYVELLDNDRLVAALWALARLSYGPTEAALRRFDAALLDRARRLTAPQVASAMWALAADGLMLTQPTIAELLAALDDAAPRLAVDDLANSLWALAFIGCRNKTLLDRLCASAKALLPHFKPHHVGIVFFALGVVAYYPGKELMEPLNDIAMAWQRNMHAIDFLHTLWGWARLQYRPPPAHLAVLQETLNPLVEAKCFTPEQLALCCAACKYLGLLILDEPVLRP